MARTLSTSVGGALIDTQAESKKVLPSTLNACGKGSTLIFSDQTTTKDCSLAKKVNMGSLNTLAAQTLALGYNINPNLTPGLQRADYSPGWDARPTQQQA